MVLARAFKNLLAVSGQRITYGAQYLTCGSVAQYQALTGRPIRQVGKGLPCQCIAINVT